MGLAQKIQFKHNKPDEIEKFIIEFSQPFQLEKKDKLFILSSPEEDDFKIELAIENYGLYIHRSGNYFAILGMLLEEITGKFAGQP